MAAQIAARSQFCAVIIEKRDIRHNSKYAIFICVKLCLYGLGCSSFTDIGPALRWWHAMTLRCEPRLGRKCTSPRDFLSTERHAKPHQNIQCLDGTRIPQRFSIHIGCTHSPGAQAPSTTCPEIALQGIAGQRAQYGPYQQGGGQIHNHCMALQLSAISAIGRCVGRSTRCGSRSPVNSRSDVYRTRG